MIRMTLTASALVGLLFNSESNAQWSVDIQRKQDSTHFQFETIPPPAIDDASAGASFAIVKGRADRNSASPDVMFDGKIPANDDSPRENFFFDAGTPGGCIAIDLGKEIEIAEIVVYSWHSGSRAAQVYKLYGATEPPQEFKWNREIGNENPERVGWEFLASVDSRTRRSRGGQHASRISQPSDQKRSFRYLLFEVEATSNEDRFSNTFFSEIDVIEKNSESLKRIEIPKAKTIQFSSEDRKYQYTIDVTIVPEIEAWTEETLKPIILEWYPRIVEMLPSEDFSPPEHVRFRFMPGSEMNGIPAYAQGSTITLNAGWMIREKNREAAGAVVHEMVHIVQAYQGQPGRNRPRVRTPGWIVEGIADYVRWFLYEPHTNGARLSNRALAAAKHDASYRTSANFIDWVIRNYDTDGVLLKEINAAAREGRYSTDLWEKLTGKKESELAELWRKQAAE